MSKIGPVGQGPIKPKLMGESDDTHGPAVRRAKAKLQQIAGKQTEELKQRINRLPEKIQQQPTTSTKKADFSAEVIKKEKALAAQLKASTKVLEEYGYMPSKTDS